jgi:hypothetical protein
MAVEKRESELMRLRAEQYKTLQDEIYGGLSPAEQAEYRRRADRIRELEGKIQGSAVRGSQPAEVEMPVEQEPKADAPKGNIHDAVRSSTARGLA